MTWLRTASLAAAAMAAALYAPPDAAACGGCFHPVQQNPQNESVVTAHRMALAISTTQTVLWDQVQYAGAPADFAWVLPVRPGAYVEVATDAWFETLEATTSVRVNAPALACPQNSGGGMTCVGPVPVGCGASDSAAAEGLYVQPPPDPVSVVHKGSAGPYETVTLHSTQPGALNGWLTANGYAVDDGIQPIVDAYVADGFDFIALRLAPDQGVQQMQPVRVVQPGAVQTLPLRMVAAGTGANVDLTLFVVGEGRWETATFPNATLGGAGLSWDFVSQQSDYATARELKLAEAGGTTWLTTYAQKGALLSAISNPVTGGASVYTTGYGLVATTIADAYVDQALFDGETADGTCAGRYAVLAQSTKVVVDTCADGTCGPPGPGEISRKDLLCDSADDLAVAMTGMHPRDVWVTRLEAKLPRQALSADLELRAASAQTPVQNWIVAAAGTNTPCPVAGALVAKAGGGPRRDDRPPVLLFVLGAAVSATVLRRLAGRRRARI